MANIKANTKQQPKNLSTQSTELSTEVAVEEKASAPSFVRNLTGKKNIFTDLFKLTVAKVIKYEGWDEANEHPDTHPQKFSTWEHTHPFRTFDKKGDKMTTCTPIGGHFHVVEWDIDKTNPDATPKIKSVSGPMVMKKTRVRGVMKNIPVPANEYDDHTHDVEYMRSSQIEFSTTNIEATKVMAYEAAKTAPIQGVTER